MPDDLIVITLSSFAAVDRRPLDMLEQSGIPFRLNQTGTRMTGAHLVQVGADATAIVAGVERYDRELLARLPRLRCISRCGSGIDNIDLDEAQRRGIVVLTTPRPPVDAVAELAVAMILALRRQIVRHTVLMRSRRWERLQTHLLQGATVGIIGFGRIGRRVAELLAPFNVHILVCDPSLGADSALPRDVQAVTLPALLSMSDIVSIHAAKTSTQPLRLEAADLSRMRRGALLVNVARSDFVDERALYEALRSGYLAGAGIDVFPEEPYSGPLCDLDNVVLTPHAASYPVETRTMMEIAAVENILAQLRL